MKEYDSATYGDRIAEVYDELFPQPDPASIEMLAELAAGGPALELGIGSGRVALPLGRSGVRVVGIDASEAMLAKLRAKDPGGPAFRGDVELVTGSFADFELDEKFRLVYVVFSTLFALPTQSEQVSCFEAAAKHLLPDGVFLVEAFVPDPCRFVDGQAVRAVEVTEHVVQLDVSKFDPAAQQVTTQHVFLSQGGTRLYPVKLRYAWPSELDLMARIAGLSLRHRWGSWARDPFTRESTKHISVYHRA